MRGKYRLDEIGDGKDELKFKQGTKTILTIYLHEDKYTFLVIFGKKEQEVFEIRRHEFSKYILDYYDGSKTYHDGKWMFIDVTTLEQLEEVKKLILIKKKPNRKPFPKEKAVYTMCGLKYITQMKLLGAFCHMFRINTINSVAQKVCIYY